MSFSLCFGEDIKPCVLPCPLAAEAKATVPLVYCFHDSQPDHGRRVPFPVTEAQAVTWQSHSLDGQDLDVRPLFRLWDYFGLPRPTTFVAQLLASPKPITRFTASLASGLCNPQRLQEMPRIPGLTWLERASYQCLHDNIEGIKKMRVKKKDVHTKLRVPSTLIPCLSSHCVIAGGSMLSLCQPASFTQLPRSDVDLFFLGSPGQAAVRQVITVLETAGYRVCRSSPAIALAVSAWGQPNIQLLGVSHLTPEALIQSFDLNAVKAFYDGQSMGLTWGCMRDWQSRTCNLGAFNQIRRPQRILGLHLKGFRLCAQGQQAVAKITIAERQQYLSDIPCLTPGLPTAVQDAQLARMGLQPFRGGEDQDMILRPLSETSYDTFGVFCGDLKSYNPGELVPVCRDVQRFFPTGTPILLPLLALPFAWPNEYNEVREDHRYGPDLFLTKLQVVNQEEFDQICLLEERMMRAPRSSTGFPTLRFQRLQDLTDVLWFRRGLPIDPPASLPKGTRLKVTAFPAFVTIPSPQSKADLNRRLAWKITSIRLL